MFLKKKIEELQRKSAVEVLSGERHPALIILDDIRSMHNVGAVFRTADAFAVSAIYLCGYTPTPPHRDIHKTALGATETVPWACFPQTVDAILAARSKGFHIVAVEQAHESVPLSRFMAGDIARQPPAFVFGNEVSGVSDEALALADTCVEIPQWGAKHSLNVSVSVGIVLWELLRLQDHTG